MFPMIPFPNDAQTCYSWNEKNGWLRCETHIMSRLTEPANLVEIGVMQKLLLERFSMEMEVLAKVPAQALNERRRVMFERNKPQT